MATPLLTTRLFVPPVRPYVAKGHLFGMALFSCSSRHARGGYRASSISWQNNGTFISNPRGSNPRWESSQAQNVFWPHTVGFALGARRCPTLLARDP